MEDLKGYEDRYTINRQGEVFSKWYNRLLNPETNRDGYLFLKLTKNHKIGEKRECHKCLIHRLLAIQYIPNPNNLPEIDHIDRQKQNNEIGNLRWCNRTQNQNNKSSNIANLTEEEQKKRKDDLRKYKAEWARNKRKSKV